MKACLFIFCLGVSSMSMAELPVEGKQGIERKRKVEEFFKKLDGSTLDLVDEFYHPNVKFIDPIGEHNSADSIKGYYKNMYKNVTAIGWEFPSHIVEGDEHALVWKMSVTAKGFNDGKPLIVDGMSHMRFDSSTEKVIFHQDHFDMGAFVYENIPVLGSLIKFIKGKFEVHE